VQHKLNAIAEGLAVLMSHQAGETLDLAQCRSELRAAVGLEDRKTHSHDVASDVARLGLSFR
jgi:hypothetical protein